MELTVNTWRNDMKNRILALVGLALLGAVSASAQNPSVRANVPFAFQVGNEHMPAGLYLIKPVVPGSFALILLGPSKTTMIMTHTASVPTVSDQGSVTFHKIGDRYYLEGLWAAGANTGVECYPSRAEKEILESSKQDSNLITLALNTFPAR